MFQSINQLGVDNLKYLDFPFNFVTEPYTLFGKTSPNNRSKSVVKAQTIAKFENKVSKELKQKQRVEMDTFLKQKIA